MGTICFCILQNANTPHAKPLCSLQQVEFANMPVAQPSPLLNTRITTFSTPRSIKNGFLDTPRSVKLSRRTHTPEEFRSGVKGVGAIRAVISTGDDKLAKVQFEKTNGALTSSSSLSDGIDVKVVLTIRKKMKVKWTEKFVNIWQSIVNGIGQGISVQLISEDIDPETGIGRRSISSTVRGWLPKQLCNAHIYGADFTVPTDFGCPGAVVVTNLQSKEFLLVEIIVHGFKEPIFFPANSWIHSQDVNPESRIIFRNKAYFPSQTPEGLEDLRREELRRVRGNGKGERKEFDRIYDYALYNDLGNPDKDKDLARPVLGGDERPYPRRCRTGRPPTISDPNAETRIEKPHPVYVPRDDAFEEIKQTTFSAGRFKGQLHNLIPALVAYLSRSEISFNCFSDVDKLFHEGVILKGKDHIMIFEKLLIPSLMKKAMTALRRLFKYEIPAIIEGDRFSWLRESEFARQTLAGVNPVNIEILKGLPILSKLDPATYGPPESLITEELLNQELQGMDVDEAIKNKRLFIIDYHDLLLPFIKSMNKLPGRKAYASRTVYFYNKGSLHPVAIELSLPPSPETSITKRVYTPGHDATKYWIWKLAKAHVCSNDSGVHQLVNHWLRTHACMEAYIIATHRQLSSMHPIFKLLHPHMRYTLEINAVARQNLINGGGVIETCFSPGRYAMELSSAAYKSTWRFDMEGLPADLIRRGMAVEDPSTPAGVRLVIEDYPYAADGLLVWTAIKEWVEAYVAHFYVEPYSVSTDDELQSWWDEIKNKGHYDKRNEPWWPKLQTNEDLSGILTIMIWIASGQHAAINFGQYPYGGYVPNRPTLLRKHIPQEHEPAYEEFLLHPEKAFLSALPTQTDATKVMAVQDTLSTHSPDEEYLGQMHQWHQRWIDDGEIKELFGRFSSKLDTIEETINARNKDSNLKNRTGAGVPPYEMLLRSSEPGVTARGIPNSVSI